MPLLHIGPTVILRTRASRTRLVMDASSLVRTIGHRDAMIFSSLAFRRSRIHDWARKGRLDRLCYRTRI